MGQGPPLAKLSHSLRAVVFSDEDKRTMKGLENSTWLAYHTAYKYKKPTPAFVAHDIQRALSITSAILIRATECHYDSSSFVLWTLPRRSNQSF